jgi:hypothetical protein
MGKISKKTAQEAKDKALRERQRLRSMGGKNMTASQKKGIADQTKIIEAADKIINEEE